MEWRITDAYNYADNTTFCGCDLDLNSLIIRINNDQVFALKSNYPAHLVKFTEEILNGKLYFLCSDRNKCDFPIARFKWIL